MVYKSYRQKYLLISNIDNLSIPDIDINVLSIPHVDKLSIPQQTKGIRLYDIKTTCLHVV